MPTDCLLELKAKPDGIKTVAVVIMLGGKLEDQISALIVPKCLVSQGCPEYVISEWINRGAIG